MSIPVPLHGFGSGGASLNFKVVGGLTQPADPKENTIWVNTNTEITSWVVSPVMPSEPEDGMVWITNGKASRVVINLLKKNAVYVYPQLIRQYVGGAWVSRDAYCYQNGSWTALWFGQLYTAGEEWTAITGGWTSTAKKSSSESGASAKAPTITRGTASITAKVSGGGVFHTVNKIDLTEFSTLAFRGEFKRGGSSGRNLMAACWNSFGTYYDDSHVAASKDAPSGTFSELVVDISKLSGSYIVGLGMTDSEAAVEEIVMEADNSLEVS